VEHSPSAAIASAWLGISTGDIERIARSIRAAEAIEWDGPLSDGSPSLAVATAAVRSIVAAEGTDGVLRDTEIIRNGGGPRTNPWWGYATCLDGTVATLVGDNESARALLTAGLPEVAHLPSFEAGFLGVLALLEVYEDDLVAALRHAHRARRLCDEHNLEALTLVIPTYAGAALVAARLGRADESRRDAQVTRRLLARLGDLSPRSALRGYVALAQAAVALGDLDDARALALEAADARRRDPSCPYLNDQLVELERHLTNRDSSGSGPTSISAAELRVLTYMPTHLSLREIAEAVYLSRNTVKTHVVAIYRKLGVSSRAEAVVAAGQLGLIDIPGQLRTSGNPADAAPLD
jgi:LuxR family transcriptional regulator, maltose regulon positive regulatory protein